MIGLNLIFLDSFQFMSQSLDNLVKIYLMMPLNILLKSFKTIIRCNEEKRSIPI